MKKDYCKVRITKYDGINSWDAPKFVDKYASEAEWEDGTPLTEDELDVLNDEYNDVVHDKFVEDR